MVHQPVPRGWVTVHSQATMHGSGCVLPQHVWGRVAYKLLLLIRIELLMCVHAGPCAGSCMTASLSAH